MPNVDVIIVGYGSAGKRHEAAARKRNLSVVTVDPDHTKKALMFDYVHALRVYKPRMVVVATPPGDHLGVIEDALEVTPYILCEKPLCGFGQIAWAQAILDKFPDQKVNVAYNYRYHHNIMTFGDFFEAAGEYNRAIMYNSQYRAIKPSWGYALDHLSHDLDIMRVLVGDEIEITDAAHLYSPVGETWKITARHANVGIHITETVTRDPSERVAGVRCESADRKSGFFLGLDPDPMMYEIMWDKFLSFENIRVGVDITMGDAMMTQKLLDDVYGGAYHEFAE